jgi:hypothetical protein
VSASVVIEVIKDSECDLIAQATLLFMLSQNATVAAHPGRMGRGETTSLVSFLMALGFHLPLHSRSHGGGCMSSGAFASSRHIDVLLDSA